MGKIYLLFNNISIKRKFVIIYVSLILVTLLNTLFHINRMRNVVYDHSLQQLNIELMQQEQNMVTLLRTYKNLIERLENDYSINKFIETYYETTYDAYEYYIGSIQPLEYYARNLKADIRIFSNNRTINVSSVTNNI